MKISNTIRKVVYTFFLFLCLNLAFAVTEPVFDDDVVDAPAAPIDSNLIWLGIVGTLYAGYYFIQGEIKP
jgi:hypothetical protein